MFKVRSYIFVPENILDPDLLKSNGVIEILLYGPFKRGKVHREIGREPRQDDPVKINI